MFNRSSEVEIPSEGWHHRISERKHRSCKKMFPSGKQNPELDFPIQQTCWWQGESCCEHSGWKLGRTLPQVHQGGPQETKEGSFRKRPLEELQDRQGSSWTCKSTAGCLLKRNADLFSWSAADMPGIDPIVACHQLTVDPGVSVVAQRRRKQSPEKSEAAEKAVKDLLEANFISEA